jgi:hypothetical protein
LLLLLGRNETAEFLEALLPMDFLFSTLLGLGKDRGWVTSGTMPQKLNSRTLLMLSFISNSAIVLGLSYLRFYLFCLR